MVKAGIFEYPDIELETVITKLRKYHETLKTDEANRKIVANTLEMSLRGGRFIELVSSMDKYGLIDTGNKKIRITNLGKLILYGTTREQKQAMSKAVSNITLFVELDKRYGQQINEEQIRTFLMQEGKVDISEAKKSAKNVYKIYKKVANYIIPTKKIGRRDRTIPTEIGKEPLTIQTGGLYVEISTDQNTLENIENAKDLLAFWGNKIRSKQKKEDTK